MTRILLDDPAHAGGSSQLVIGTLGVGGSGQGAHTTGAKLKQNLADLNAMMAEMYPSNGALIGPMTFQQLITQYTSSNVVGSPVVTTSDLGPCSFFAGAWRPLSPFILSQSAVPFVYGPNYTMGNNGAVTLGTALDATYPNAYMYFNTGGIASGSQQGWYFVQMSSTTVGTVFNNLYSFGQPVIPASPTPFVTTGSGAITQTLTGIVGPTGNLPANVLGLNGEIEVSTTVSASNSANAKSVVANLADSSMFGTDVITTAQWRSVRHLMRNRGAANSQAGLIGGAGDIGTGTGIQTLAIDTTVGHPVSFTLNLGGTGTDWVILQQYGIKVFPSALNDAPASQIVTLAGPTIVPSGAKALNYLTNKFFLAPTATDVSYVDSDISHAIYAGIYSNTHPPFSSASGHSTTVNGMLSLNQLGDFTSPHFATINQNLTGGALPTLLASNGFYVEYAVRLSSNNQDHWPAVWLLPIEHNFPNGSTFPYVELDADEGGSIFTRNANNPFWGSANSVLNWASGSGGSPTTSNSLSAGNFGVNIDRTVEHIFGISYDPVGKVVAFWLDGVKKPFTKSTAAFDSNISPLHYYLLMSPQTNGGNVPYSMYIRYFSAWTP